MDDDPTQQPGHSSRFSPISFLSGFGFCSFVGVGLALLVFFLVRDGNIASTTIVTVPPSPDLPPSPPQTHTPHPTCLRRLRYNRSRLVMSVTVSPYSPTDAL